MKHFTLEEFVRESNRIEGIEIPPSLAEIIAHTELLNARPLSMKDIETFVSLVQPGARLRDKIGDDVIVGKHTPPAGGPVIRKRLTAMLRAYLEGFSEHPWNWHCEYENIHTSTDGNGRSGRALWLYMMGGIDNVPLGFLHSFYYQTLSRRRG